MTSLSTILLIPSHVEKFECCLHLVQEELGKERRAKHELEEMCEQLQLQVCKLSVLYSPYYH